MKSLDEEQQYWNDSKKCLVILKQAKNPTSQALQHPFFIYAHLKQHVPLVFYSQGFFLKLQPTRAIVVEYGHTWGQYLYDYTTKLARNQDYY
jgi:hypothetical protein